MWNLIPTHNLMDTEKRLVVPRGERVKGRRSMREMSEEFQKVKKLAKFHVKHEILKSKFFYI